VGPHLATSQEEQNMTDWKQFEDQAYLSLETFRKNGIGVKTVVWFVQDGGVLSIWTRADSGKVKRLRNTARVNIAPCTRFGQITGAWQAAQASVDDSAAEVRHLVVRLRQKYGVGFIVFGTIEILIERRRGQQRVAVKVSLGENE
jgi:hypothetical protein